jgi:hypothetical protein
VTGRGVYSQRSTNNERWRMTGVYFLAFSLAGPEASLTARLATAAD